MSGPQTVPIALGERSYEILIEPGCLADAGRLLAPQLPGGRVLLIADATVAALHGRTLLDSLASAGIAAELTSFPAGEPFKQLDTCARLWQACADARIDRAGAIIALGGGVCGDLAGFIAATWMRGIAFVQVPTTLLAMVDSAVGGKTGINAPAGKNLIGAFCQPRAVLIDPTVLTTMEAREYRAGLAEVAKYGVIREPEFLAWQETNVAALLAREPAAVAHAVATSCRIKGWYVEQDEHEQGLRAELNYGHTFGHALERETGYAHWRHGEAVAIGMVMAAAAARHLGLLREPELEARQLALLASYGLPISQPTDEPEALIDRLLAATTLDKKARAGTVRFVLPEAAGRMHLVVGPDPAAIRAGFAAGIVPPPRH